VPPQASLQWKSQLASPMLKSPPSRPGKGRAGRENRTPMACWKAKITSTENLYQYSIGEFSDFLVPAQVPNLPPDVPTLPKLRRSPAAS
jgi:hypothetical protein